jgi:hypothetical protein
VEPKKNPSVDASPSVPIGEQDEGLLTGHNLTDASRIPWPVGSTICPWMYPYGVSRIVPVELLFST